MGKKIICKSKTFYMLCLLYLLFVATNSVFSQEQINFNRAVEEYRQGKYENALSILDKLENNDPKNLYIKYYKAISQVKIGNYEEARNNYMAIINNSDDSTLTENAKKGISLIDPDYMANIEKRNYSLVEPSKNITKQNPIVQPNSQENLMHNETSNNSGVSSEELNNLVALLAKNPSAIQTLIKLAKNANPNLQIPESKQNVDPESLAKWVKMMTLNSQLDLLKSTSNNDDNNDNNKNNDSFFDMSKYYSSMYKMPLNNKMDNNEAMKNYLNNMTGNSNMNPDVLNMIFQQGMSGNSGNNFGF